MATIPLPANGARQAGPERDFTTWADLHQRDKRRHLAAIAQISHHHELNPAGDATRQLQAWAVRQAHQRHLHDSAMAQIRPH